MKKFITNDLSEYLFKIKISKLLCIDIDCVIYNFDNNIA